MTAADRRCIRGRWIVVDPFRMMRSVCVTAFLGAGVGRRHVGEGCCCFADRRQGPADYRNDGCRNAARPAGS